MNTELFINVTDIFGSMNISNDTPILFIYSENIHQLLRKLDTDKTSSIWEINVNKVNEILKNRNLDASNYISLGHIYIKNNNFQIKKIILAKKSFVQPNSDFNYIGTYGKGTVWEPIGHNMKSLGLVYNRSEEKPHFHVGIFPQDLILEDSVDTKNYANSNYGLLTHFNIGLRRISTGKLYNGINPFKLMNSDGNYMTEINNELTIKPKNKDQHQEVSYNAQGELIINGKCLTKENNNIKLEKCEGNKKQKWIPRDNNISTYDENNCITSSDSNVSLKPCYPDNINQDWHMEESDTSKNTDYSLRKYKGKTVVLVEADNPWYVNKDSTTIEPVNKSQELRQIDHKFADYKPTNFIIDTTKPDMGYGYSYASRQGVPCIEKFGDDNDDHMIMIVICIIVLVILGYNIYMRK